MSEKTRKLRLFVSLDEIEGCGDEVVFKLRGHHKLKSGRLERFELELVSCRHGVLQVQDGLRKMHARDRERIRGEERRIDREIRRLTEEPTI